jgi:Flp pilus assembly protein TadG
LVEFALILPLLLLLILGIIEFGYVFTVYTGLFNAAREGARYGVVRPSDVSGIESRTRGKIFLVDPNAVDMDITVRYDNGPGTEPFTNTAQVQIGDRVLVHLTYDLPTITPVIQPIASTLHVETEAARTIATLGDAAILTRPIPMATGSAMPATTVLLSPTLTRPIPMTTGSAMPATTAARPWT